MNVRIHCLIFISPILLIFAFHSVQAQVENWQPIVLEDLGIQKPKVEADADVEAIFWELQIDDSASFNTKTKNYFRIKIYSERGRNQFSKINIPIPIDGKIVEFAARVVKSDGVAVEIKKDEIFIQEIVKTAGLSKKEISFALPNLEIGSIIDYYVIEKTGFSGAVGDKPIIFQKDFPIQKLVFRVKTQKSSKTSIGKFNMPEQTETIDSEGFQTYTFTNITALKNEPNLPPVKNYAQWLSVSIFPKILGLDPDKFWAQKAGEYLIIFRLNSIFRTNETLRQKALQIVDGATDDDKKIYKLAEFCRNSVENIELSEKIDMKEKIKLRAKTMSVKAQDSPEYTLKSMKAFPLEINELFAALSFQLGFETRYVFTANRNEILFNPIYKNRRFIEFVGIAVKIGGKWKYFDLSKPNVPIGLMPFERENQPALLVGASIFSWDRIPLTNAQNSILKRTGKLKLSADGNLKGRLALEFSGQSAIELRNFLDKKAKSERDSAILQYLNETYSAFNAENVTSEIFQDANKNPKIYFEVNISNYLTKTGKMLFFQPSFFEFKRPNIFTSSTRRHPIYFKYPLTQIDEIEFEIPDGYKVEIPENTLTAKSEDTNIEAVATIENKGNILLFKRQFALGKLGKIYYLPGEYSVIKKIFDEIRINDDYLILMNQ